MWSSNHHLAQTNSRKILALAQRVAVDTAWRIDQWEVDVAGRGNAGSTTRELYLRARRLSSTLDPADNATAITILDKALDVEPDNLLILAAACEARHHRMAMGMPPLGPNDASDSAALARRGLGQHNVGADEVAVFGITLYRAEDRDRGLALTQAAVGLNASSVKALHMFANCAMHWGSIGEAETSYRRALSLGAPRVEQALLLGGLSRIAMMKREYEDALHWAGRANALNSNFGGAHWTLVAAHAQLHHRERALERLARFRAVHPHASAATICAGQPTRAGRMNATMDGLHMTGLPDH